MQQSTPHYNPWADDPEDSHGMTEDELLQFVHAAEKVMHEKRRMRKHLDKSRQGVVVPPKMPRQY